MGEIPSEQRLSAIYKFGGQKLFTLYFK
jgi:hypothetical protein